MKLIKPYFKIKENSNLLLALEEAGRVCYKSEDKITKNSAEKFVKMLIQRGHESVLEHERFCFSISAADYKSYRIIHENLYDLSRSDIKGIEISENRGNMFISLNIRSLRDSLRAFNIKENNLIQNIANIVHKKYPILIQDLFKKEIKYLNKLVLLDKSSIINILPPHEAAKHINATVQIVCDRGVSHEIVRHRMFSYSQESTRYVKYNGDMEFIIPIWSDILPGHYNDALEIDENVDINSKIWATSVFTLVTAYTMLTSDGGWKPEQARSILPNSLKTEIVMSGNLINWKHFFKLRAAKPAHPQMQEIAYPMLDKFKSLYPLIF